MDSGGGGDNIKKIVKGKIVFSLLERISITFDVRNGLNESHLAIGQH